MSGAQDPGSSLGHLPNGRWAFDDDVTECFEDMLARSIPQYEVMRRACFDLGCRYVQYRTDIVDLGCSRGDALDPFVRRYGCHNRYVGVEVSPPMLEVARQRYQGYIASGVAEIRADDLRTAYPPSRASLTLCVLTLQFTPIEYRQAIVRNIFKATVPGGALILVEKVIGATAETDAALVALYHSLKAENGYSGDEIDRKRLALEGVLVPVTAKWNEELLRAAGFQEVECFWRWMNFAGWVAVRE
jgi:tRNA (cmo5U34)-methyltransferase